MKREWWCTSLSIWGVLSLACICWSIVFSIHVLLHCPLIHLHKQTSTALESRYAYGDHASLFSHTYYSVLCSISNLHAFQSAYIFFLPNKTIHHRYWSNVCKHTGKCFPNNCIHAFWGIQQILNAEHGIIDYGLCRKSKQTLHRSEMRVGAVRNALDYRQSIAVLWRA